MKNKKKKNDRFSSLLIRNYILFTLSVVICGILVFSFAGFLISQVIKEPHPEKIHNYDSLLSSGKYDEIPVKHFLGKTGYIEVLDENNNLIYTNGPKNEIQYTDELLKCIPVYNANTYTDITEYQTENNEKRILVTKNIYGENQNDSIDEFILFDENQNIIASTWKIDKSTFTKEEYLYFIQQSEPGYKITKYIFSSQTGTSYTLLIHASDVTDALIDKAYNIIFVVAAIVFVLFYFLTVLLFIRWMNRKVKTPLALLDAAIIDFAERKHHDFIEYKGPKEFMQICENFNMMADKLDESEHERARLTADKQKMLADISHDLKTPITVIQGYTKAMHDGLIPDDEKKQCLTTIYQKSCLLTDLINKFYEYSKLEHPNFNLELEKYDICEFSREYLASRYDEIEHANFFLEIDISSKVIFCNFDKLQITRVFDNLLSNAMKYNKSGTHLYFLLRNENNSIKIVFADDGIGIPAEMTEYVFDAFVVGDDSRNKLSSGLGLAIAKKIIAVHGGTIKLNDPSEFGYTTEFEITLPISIDS